MPASARSRPEDIVENLSSGDTSARLKALRDVKNQIIGNRSKKLCYIKLGAVPRVAEILASDTESNFLVQSAAAVGSFACGIDSGVRAVLDSGCLPHLLNTLSNKDEKVVEAGARSLRMIFQSQLAPHGAAFFKDGRALDHILKLLASPNDDISEVAASVLARCCNFPEQRSAIAASGSLRGLLRLLAHSNPRKVETALDAIASLTRDNEQQSRELLNAPGNPFLNVIVPTVKEKSGKARLLACACVANISRTCPEYGTESTAGPSGSARDVAASVISALVKLIDHTEEAGEEAPSVLAHFIEDSEDLQKLACDADAIGKLSAKLVSDSETLTPRHRENIFRALAALCSTREEGRRQLVESRALLPIISGLDDGTPGVRAAACSCTKSLSRSVKNLRTSLVDASIAEPLFRLLGDPDPSVQATASATLCNIVLDFSPMRSQSVLESGGVSQLVSLTQSMDPVLRLNSVWALRNLLFMADSATKRRVMREVGYPTLAQLVQDPEDDVQEQALMLFRNLVHGKAEDIEEAIRPENGVLEVVDRKLATSQRPEVCVQALYVMVNVATGTEEHKERVMGTCTPAVLGKFLGDESNPQIRVAAVWVLINLTYSKGANVRSRVERLRHLGLDTQLRKLVIDSCLDVQDRVKTALEQFQEAVQPLPHSPVQMVTAHIC